MTAVGERQIRCDYAPCGTITWRHNSCRVGGKHFCSRECRDAYQRQAEAEAADERLRILNVAYGDGVLCGVLGIGACEASGACREQHLRGVMDGRTVRRSGDEYC